jgi:SAM-dependent methyltransferase
MTRAREHWESVYQRKDPSQVSWYRPHLEQSLRFIDGAGLGRDAAIIDVGGGASTLVDDLLERGYQNVTVLDVSAKAIASTRTRLGQRAAGVSWLVADITEVELPPAAYGLWHDRAVFHFLREEAERRRYLAALRGALEPGGHVVLATFGPEGPTRCSGLDVVRYAPADLMKELGDAFEEIESVTELHATPSGAAQQFTYCHCRLRRTR